MSEQKIDVDFGGGRHASVPVELPSNSKYRKPRPSAAKEEPKKETEKIITGEVTQRKKGIGYRFREAFAGDGSGGIVETIVTDILVAAVKAMISDAVTQGSDAIRQGFDRYLYGDTRTPGSSYRRPVNYAGFSKIRRYQERPEFRSISAQARARHDFDDIILETRGDAEEVIDHLREIIEEYGAVSVKDLYGFLGITSSYTDGKWGWDDLEAAGVRAVRGGYLLVLPKTQIID